MSSIIKPVLGSQLNLGHPLATGLVGLWLFNEGSGGQVFDLSGNNNHGTLINSPVWSAGKFGTSLLFAKASSQYVDGSYVHTADYITVVTWIYPTYDSDTVYIVDSSDGATGFALRQVTNERYEWFAYVGGAAGVVQSTVAAQKNTEWIQIVSVHDAAGNKLYINGVLDNSTANAGVIADSSAPVNIAAEFDNTDTFGGYISHVIIYDRALTASEVALLYREPFCMFERDLIELWSAATLGAAPTGMAGAMTTNTGYWGW